MRLFFDKENNELNVADNIAIRCSNCRETTGFLVKKSIYKEMITHFVLNTVFHHVGMSWIIEINNNWNKISTNIIHIG